MPSRVLVIGGVAAGMTAASAVRKSVAEDVEVVVLERGGWTSYSACGVPYWIGGDVGSMQDLVARTPEEHRDNGIDVRLGWGVESLDLPGRALSATVGSKTHRLEWDRLVVATGAESVRPDLPGIDGDGVHAIKDLDDGSAVIDALKNGVRRAVVVGSGYIGLEMAEAFVTRGLETTVLERESTPLPIVDDPISERIAEAVRERGVDLVLGTEVTGLELDDTGHVCAVLTEQGRHEADVVVVALGVAPRTKLLAGVEGIETGAKDGLVVDDQQRLVGADDVWAAGDCVLSRDRLTGELIHLPLGTHANKQGLVAGESVAASLGVSWTGRTFPGVVQTAITKFCDLEIARTGLGESQARDAGFDPVVATIESTTTAGYWPTAEPMRVLGVADRSTRRLLGVQVAGGAGSGLRIDVAVMALWEGQTVDELVMTDLAYAPPFSSVWSPVQVVARALTKQLGS